MRHFRCAPAAFLALLAAPAAAQERPVYEPTWESLNTHPVPAWFRDAKFGIFIHWGVYSVPAYCDLSTYAEWYYWWLRTNSHGGLVRRFHETWYGADFEYREFAPQFRAELWDPQAWARLFERAGARYVVLVSKHHDGFALWPNALASEVRGHPWNAMDVGPRRDLVGELTEAVRARGLKMGFYYSFLEWANPVFDRSLPEYVERVMIPQIRELVTRYRPAVFWPDGEWEHPDTVWRSPEILAWIYNHCTNPEELVVNDRWGKGLRGHSGDYYTTEYGNIGGGSDTMVDTSRPFEECRGIGHSFALNRLEDIDRYQTRESLIRMLITLVSQGGSLLLNVGPTADGRIPVIQQDRLVAIGDWLRVHGEAIYGTTGSRFRELPFGRSTTKGNTVYLHVFDWPADHRLTIPDLRTEIRRARFLHEAPERSVEVLRDEQGRAVLDLLGHLPHPGASVVALTFDEPPAIDCGRPPAGAIVLEAPAAELAGGVQLEHGTFRGEERSNIGFWTDPRGSVTWRTRVAAGKPYALWLEYGSHPGTEGSTFHVTVGDRRLTSRIPASTQSWHDYRVLPLGTLTTDTGGEVEVSVTVAHIERTALMNLRRLTLVPVE